MMTRLEQETCEAVLHASHSIISNLGKIADSLQHLSNSTPVPICPDRPLPPECMDFDEWASDLCFDDRRRLMVFLWEHPYWHKTCVRMPDIQQSAMGPGDDDDDLPF